MIELLSSGAATSLPLLPHLLRASLNIAAGGAAPGSAVKRSFLLPPVAGAKAGKTSQQQQGQEHQKQQQHEQQEEKQQQEGEELGEKEGQHEAAAKPPQPSGSPCYSCSEDEEALADSPLVQAAHIIRRFGLNEEQGGENEAYKRRVGVVSRL